MRPRWCLRCLTFLGISMIETSSLARKFGVSDCSRVEASILLIEQSFEFGIGFLDERCRLFVDLLTAPSVSGWRRLRAALDTTLRGLVLWPDVRRRPSPPRGWPCPRSGS